MTSLAVQTVLIVFKMQYIFHCSHIYKFNWKQQ